MNINLKPLLPSPSWSAAINHLPLASPLFPAEVIFKSACLLEKLFSCVVCHRFKAALA